MHGKRKFAKVKGSICNILIEAENIWNICKDLQFQMD